MASKGYDYERLREVLIDYFWEAVSKGMPQGQIYANKAKEADNDELISMANEQGFELSFFEED